MTLFVKPMHVDLNCSFLFYRWTCRGSVPLPSNWQDPCATTPRLWSGWWGGWPSLWWGWRIWGRRQEKGLQRVNVRRQSHNCCKVCGLPRTKETGHSCQRGYLYCPQNPAKETKEEWLARLKTTKLAKQQWGRRRHDVLSFNVNGSFQGHPIFYKERKISIT